MFIRNRHNKILLTILAVLLLFTFAGSTAIDSIYFQHECDDGNCIICLVLDFLATMNQLFVLLVFLHFCFILSLLADRVKDKLQTFYAGSANPVKLKTKLII